MLFETGLGRREAFVGKRRLGSGLDGDGAADQSEDGKVVDLVGVYEELVSRLTECLSLVR